MPACSFCGVRLTQTDVDANNCPVCAKTLTLRDRLEFDGEVVVATASMDAVAAANGQDRAAAAAGSEESAADFCTVDFTADAPFDPSETVDLLAHSLQQESADIDGSQTIPVDESLTQSDAVAAAAGIESAESVDDVLNGSTIDLNELNLEAIPGLRKDDSGETAAADSSTNDSGGLRPHLTKPKARPAASAKKD